MVSVRDKLPSGLFPLIVVGLLAALTFWLEEASRPDTARKDGKYRHDPDYFVENLTLRRYDPAGSLQHTLHAEHMRHFPDDDTTEIDLPQLTYHRSPGTHVSARNAWLNSGATYVRLFDDVIVTRSGIGKRADSRLTTQLLDAYPDEEIVATDAPVILRQGHSSVNGSALRANNKASFYILEGPVRGIFYRNGAGSATIPTSTAVSTGSSKTVLPVLPRTLADKAKPNSGRKKHRIPSTQKIKPATKSGH